MAFIKQVLDHLVELENPLDTRDTPPSGLKLLFPKLEFLEVASTALLPDPRGTPTADETRPRYLRRLGSPPTVCITIPDWPDKPSTETMFARLVLQQGPTEDGVRSVGYWASLLRALLDPNKRKQVYVHRMDGACLMPTVDSAHDYHLFYPRSTSAEFDDHPIVMARLAVYGTMLYQPLEQGEEDDEWEYVSDSDKQTTRNLLRKMVMNTSVQEMGTRRGRQLRRTSAITLQSFDPAGRSLAKHGTSARRTLRARRWGTCLQRIWSR